LAYGFFARVLSGPRFSPLAQLVTRVITPMVPVPAKLVPGPPKRFAQAVGLVMASTAAVLALGFGLTTPAYAITGLIVVAAVLESGFGFCVGCRLFAMLMRLGIVPDEMDGGHLPALGHPHELVQRLEAYRAALVASQERSGR